MKIKPTYITFEQAKYLAERGCKIDCDCAYAEERFIDPKTGGDKFTGVWRLVTRSSFHKKYYPAPEQQELVEWLFLNCHIWVSVDNLIDNKFYFSIRHTNTSNYASRTGCNEEGYNSLQEAYSAAFDYIQQNNLI